MFKKSIEEDCEEIKRNNNYNLPGNYGNYMGLLDFDFFTLMNPAAFGPIRFWRVILSYFRAYLFMANGILKNDNYKEMLGNPTKTYLDTKKQMCSSAR